MERWSNTNKHLTKFTYTWAIDDFRGAFALAHEKLSSALFDEDFPMKMQWQFHISTKIIREHEPRWKYYMDVHYLCFDATLNKVSGPFVEAAIEFSVIMPNGAKEYVNVELLGAKPSTGSLEEYPSRQFQCKRDLITGDLSRVISNDRLTVRFVISLPNVANENSAVIQNNREAPLKLCGNLGRMLENESFADIALIVGGQSIRAHKVVLAAQSDVFAAMFQHDMLESSTNEVKIPDVSPEVFRETLHFIYTGRVRDEVILAEMALEMITVADKYALGELKDLCERSLLQTICPETAAEILFVAETHSFNQLKSYAIAYIKGNIAKVSLTSGWRKLLNAHDHLVKEFLA